MTTGHADPATFGITVTFGCTQCGAPSSVDADAVSVTCAHCGTFLVIAHPGRERLFVQPGRLQAAADLAETVVLYRVTAQRAEIVARLAPDPEQRGDLSEWLIQRELDRYQEHLRSVLRIREAHRLHVPYWHLSGLVTQAVLGRRRGLGPKEVIVRGFHLEHTEPGYDPRGANFRDRGLRLGGSTVRPLTRQDVAELRAFVPWIPLQPRTYREVERWLGRDLDPDVETVTRHGRLLFRREILVFRPYWLALVESDRAPEWLLFDGAFGTLAGHPEPEEVRSLLRRAVADPEGEGRPGTRAVPHPSRCPDCGGEVRFAPHEQARVCGNCHLLLEPRERGVTVAHCDHAAVGEVSLDAAYLPFWVFPFEVDAAGAPPCNTLEDWARLVHPQQRPPGFAPRGHALWIPATRLLGSEPGDAAFQEIAQAVHAAPPALRHGKVPLGGHAVCLPVTLGEREAREAAPFVLFALQEKTSASRLSAIAFKRALATPELMLGPATLVMVPFVAHSDAYVLAGTHAAIPALFAAGDPAADALRCTIARLQSEEA